MYSKNTEAKKRLALEEELKRVEAATEEAYGREGLRTAVRHFVSMVASTTFSPAFIWVSEEEVRAEREHIRYLDEQRRRIHLEIATLDNPALRERGSYHVARITEIPARGNPVEHHIN